MLVHGLAPTPSSGELTDRDMQALITSLKEVQVVKDLCWSSETVEGKAHDEAETKTELSSGAVCHTDVNLFSRLSALRQQEEGASASEVAITAVNGSLKALSANFPFADDVVEVSGPAAAVNAPLLHLAASGTAPGPSSSAPVSVLAANQIAFARCGGADRLLRLLESSGLVRDFGEQAVAALPADTDASARLRLHLQGERAYLDELRLADACLAVLDFESASEPVWAIPGRVAHAALRLAIASMACYAVDVCANRDQLAAEGLALLQGEDFISVVVRQRQK